MKNKYLFFLISLTMTYFSASAQKKTADSLSQKQLDEVVVIAKFDIGQQHKKALSSLDSYLETNPSVNMLKRGAYAWEPLINGMASERSLITIDGMRIYGACTDKMDPISSYVEITNLSSANIQNGQNGAKHGATIAGSIDLVRSHSNFDNSGFRGTLLSGLETNNYQKIVGSKLQYAQQKFYTDIDFTLRKANDYKAGGGSKVNYSQFSKYNLSTISGFKLDEHSSLSASLIYDKATDIGYPALPMDVAKAEAIIGSLQYTKQHLSTYIHQWDSKIYYNKVSHVMDDSKRPIVPIRMDMPGWSETAGFYSQLKGDFSEHHWIANLSAHYNHSLAEMTMFSTNPNENDMFMLTWPGVNTYYTNFYIEDKFQLNENLLMNVSIANSINYQQLGSLLGFESLQIFYPDMQRGKLRWLKSINLSLSKQNENWLNTIGLAYGDRAPSVSEAYGFYLFNSMDSYDYIGNPNLKNEQSVNLSFSSSYHRKDVLLKLQANYFYLTDYIIGTPQNSLLPMTIGAKGIKKYEQFNQAQIFNLGLSGTYQWTNNWSSNARILYRFGKADLINLPQIQPFTYTMALKYAKNTFNAEIGLEGANKQYNYSAYFAEVPANDYLLMNATVAKQFKVNKQQILVKLGVENIMDKYYRTFSDWNNIPQMGRNFYLNVVYKF